MPDPSNSQSQSSAPPTLSIQHSALSIAPPPEIEIRNSPSDITPASPCPIVLASSPGVSPSSDPSPHDDPLPASLSPRQQTVIQCLYRNATLPEAAKGAGLTPRTVYRWIQHHPDFAALYNAWEAQKQLSHRARALAALDKAMDVVVNAVEKQNLAAAFHILKQADSLIRSSRPAPTDADEIRRKNAIRDTRKNKRLSAHEQKLGLHIPAVPRNLAEVEEAMGDLSKMRDDMISHLEARWCHYEEFKHLTKQEYAAHYTAKQYPHGPPPTPRPTWLQFVASLERNCQRHNWHFKSFLSEARRARRASRKPQSPPIANRQSQIANPPTQHSELTIAPPPPSQIGNRKSEIVNAPASPSPTRPLAPSTSPPPPQRPPHKPQPYTDPEPGPDPDSNIIRFSDPTWKELW